MEVTTINLDYLQKNSVYITKLHKAQCAKAHKIKSFICLVLFIVCYFLLNLIDHNCFIVIGLMYIEHIKRR